MKKKHKNLKVKRGGPTASEFREVKITRRKGSPKKKALPPWRDVRDLMDKD
jgi:hypothetical protein